jgi:hypothetical protein
MQLVLLPVAVTRTQNVAGIPEKNPPVAGVGSQVRLLPQPEPWKLKSHCVMPVTLSLPPPSTVQAMLPEPAPLPQLVKTCITMGLPLVVSVMRGP